MRPEYSKEVTRGRKSEKSKQYNSLRKGQKGTRRFTTNQHTTCLNPNTALVTRWYPSLTEYVFRTGHQENINWNESGPDYDFVGPLATNTMRS